MKNLFLLLIFLSSLKGYGQTITSGQFGIVTDSLGRISADKSFEKSIFIDTIRFLSHLSDEYLNSHGYKRIVTKSTDKLDLSIPKGDAFRPDMVSRSILMLYNDFVKEIKAGCGTCPYYIDFEMFIAYLRKKK
jgi:hypothetical protein